MNEPQDPFESFLEDALSGPDDLDLGHEMRRRLLEAAVAGDSLAKENVVPFERPDPEVAAGFDWLVGEAPATEPLMERMIRDSGFLAMLDAERGFLHTLRASLRKPAAAVVAPARRRFAPLVAISAAAALALAAGTIFFGQGGDEKAAPVVASSASKESAAPAASGPSEAGPAIEVASVTRNLAPAGIVPPAAVAPAAVPPGLPGFPEIAGDDSLSIASLGGSGQSIPADDPLLGPAAGLSLQAFAASEQVASNDSLISPESTEEFGESLVSLAGNDGAWKVGGVDSLSFGGRPAFAFNNDKAGSIPEVGGALPVMIGFMVLLLKRPRRKH